MKALKALIVDDEKHVRDAIRMLVDWERFRIGEIREAPEGESAIRIMEAEKPEIVFTDMRMPIKNGVELLEWIHRCHPGCKTIVVSGHDDFDFVRHTVKYGGMDYILKPIDADELNEAVERAVQSLSREQERRRRDQILNIEINQTKPAYWDKIFSGLVQDAGLSAAFPAHFEQEFGILTKPELGRIAILSIDTMPLRVRRKFGANLDLLFFSLANIANEYLRQNRCGYAFRRWSNRHELVLICWRSLDTLEERIREINAGIRGTLGSSLDAGIGAAKRFPEGLRESCMEAEAALKQRNLLQAAGRILHYDAGNVPRFVPLPFGRHEAEFRAALLSRQEAQIREAAARWIAALAPLPSITMEQMELWNHEYALFKTRVIGEFLAEAKAGAPAAELEAHAFLLPLDERGTLSLAMLQDIVTRDLLRLSAALERLEQREHNIIYAIVDYIDRHYHEDISLQHIADRFYMSREYISRKFKQELHENISDYIARVRIEKARRLLMNRQLRIARIAEFVGYQDEKYFSKVFKKIVGQSPTEYRNNQKA